MGKLQPSYQQRLFNDEELGLPMHDRIVRWVDLRLKNDPSVFLEALNLPHQRDDLGACLGWHSEAIQNFGALSTRVVSKGPEAFLAMRAAGQKPTPPRVEISPRTWERPIKTERGATIGFVDLSVIISVSTLLLRTSTYPVHNEASLRMEVLAEALGDREGSFVYDGANVWTKGNCEKRKLDSIAIPEGYAGIFGSKDGLHFLHSAEWSIDYNGPHSFNLYVEVKTKLRSVGELMRQINLYRTHIPKGSRFIVVAPVDQLEPETREILQEQGVGVVPYMSN